MSGRGRGGRGGGGGGRSRKPRGGRSGRRIPSDLEVEARNRKLLEEEEEGEGEEGDEEGEEGIEEGEEEDEEGENNNNNEDNNSSDDEEGGSGNKMRYGLIQIENPNHNKKAIEKTGITELSRREKEQLEKQRRDRMMDKLMAEGKTPRARADQARLAEVRKRRDEAKKERSEQKANTSSPAPKAAAHS